jgi:large subunit ribosomal protein L31
MKKDIHPKGYKLVVFRDMSNGYSFLSRSTAFFKRNGEMGRWQRVPAY